MHMLVQALEFAMVAFVAVITPGPDVMLALSNGSRYGVRRACAGMIGVLLSDFFLIAAVALGLGALLAASEFWFSMLKYVGAAYLAYIGLKMIRHAGHVSQVALERGYPPTEKPISIGLKSFWVAVTNPKSYLFFSSLLPLFIDTRAPLLLQYVILAVVLSVTEFGIMLGYAVLGARAVRFLSSSAAAWAERVCGGALIAIAATLAFFRRLATER